MKELKYEYVSTDAAHHVGWVLHPWDYVFYLRTTESVSQSYRNRRHELLKTHVTTNLTLQNT